MEMKWTPGPWRLEYIMLHGTNYGLRGVVVEDRENMPCIQGSGGARSYTEFVAKFEGTTHDEANARLIACAPEMFAALKALVSSIDDLVSDSDGVAGLHKNGDLATWDELLPGGRFEEWLLAIEPARTIIAKALGHE